jgi:hypothetical protein
VLICSAVAWQVGALDGLSPGVSATSSSDSLKGLLRGRRGGTRERERETDSERSARASRDSSSENMRDWGDYRAEPAGPPSSRTPSTRGVNLLWDSGTSSQITRVQFQVSVETKFGDCVLVVGSCPQLGWWQPDKSLHLTTDPSMYPTWTGSVEMSSSESFEYKYVIQRQGRKEGDDAESNAGEGRYFEWESAISNRKSTPEGVITILEDGKFNVERATVFDSRHNKVNLAHQRRYNDFLQLPVSSPPAGTGPPVSRAPAADKICLYIISFKLPIKTRRGPRGEYLFDWHPGSHTTTSSRHAGYVIEKLRKLGKRATIWYIGWLGIDIPECDHELVRNRLRTEMQCLPVFLDESRVAEFEKICNAIIRPMFHLSVPGPLN